MLLKTKNNLLPNLFRVYLLSILLWLTMQKCEEFNSGS